MKNSQKGSTPLLVIVVALLVIAGVYFYNIKTDKTPDEVFTPFPTDNPLTVSTPTPVPDSAPISKPNTPSAPAVSQSPTNISKAHNAFGFDLIKAIKKDEAGKNVFISPSSISLALSMVNNGAKGETGTAISKTLHLQGLDMSKVNAESLGLMETLKNPDPKVELAIANSVWARNGVDFNQSFLDTLKSYYNAQSTTLDFASPNSVKTINTWVSQNTKGKITSIVDKIPSDMVMYLINAVYFKGSWTTAFDKKLTTDKPFTLSDKTTKFVPFMSRNASLPYLETADFQSVNLTYGSNKRLSMYVFLPKDTKSFVDGLTVEKWNTWMSGYTNKTGTILLPKFKMEYEKQLRDVLSNLGMDIAFDPMKSDFSGIGKDLVISEVKHKSYVDVNEEGTEAAAVTSVGVQITSVAPPQDPFYMEVNHPFFFAIHDNQTGEILFMGVVEKP